MQSTFSERLKEALEYNNMTAAELCRRTGTPESVMSQYKSGKYKAKQRRLDQFSKALNVSVPWLMGLDVPMHEVKNDISELDEYLEALRTRPEMRMLFSLTKDATKEDVEKAVKVIEAILGK